MTILPAWRRDERIIRGALNPIPSFSPILWYDFADESTVTVVGSQVTAVADKGSRGWTLSKSSTGPTYVTGIGGRKCIDWGSAGHSNYLRNTSATSTTIAEVYIVLDAGFGSTFTDYNGLISGTTGSSWYVTGSFGNVGFFSQGEPGLKSAYINGSSTNTFSSVLPAINSPCLLRLAAADRMSNLTTGFQVGIDRTNAGRGWSGLIGEIVAFSTELSSVNSKAVGNYFSAKWGIAIV